MIQLLKLGFFQRNTLPLSRLNDKPHIIPKLVGVRFDLGFIAEKQPEQQCDQQIDGDQVKQSKSHASGFRFETRVKAYVLHPERGRLRQYFAVVLC